MWQHFIANKKIIVSLLIGALIVGLSLYSTDSFSSKTAFKRVVENKRDTVTLGELVEKDSDGDGVKDWEELLWGTDPNKKDTNGDGIPDSTEIEKKREALSTNQKTSTKNNTPQTNATDLLAQQLFSATFSLKGSGELSETTEQNLVKGVVGSLDKSAPLTYKESDLKIVDDTKDSFQKYAVSIGEIVKKYSDYGLGNELSIISKALQTNDATVLENINKLADSYDVLGKNMITINAPREISLVHLDVANGYGGIATALRKISDIFKDPIIGFTGLTEYRAYQEKTVVSLGKIETYFANNVIIFNKK